MSKEKTLTAEECFNANHDKNTMGWNALSNDFCIRFAEKYAQAKVLEREKEIKQWLIDEDYEGLAERL